MRTLEAEVRGVVVSGKMEVPAAGGLQREPAVEEALSGVPHVLAPLIFNLRLLLFAAPPKHEPTSRHRSRPFTSPQPSLYPSHPKTSIFSPQAMETSELLEQVLALVKQLDRAGSAGPVTIPSPSSALHLPPLDLPLVPSFIGKLEKLGLQPEVSRRLQDVFAKHVESSKSSVLEAYRRQGPALLASLSALDECSSTHNRPSAAILADLARGCTQRFLAVVSRLQDQLERRVKAWTSLSATSKATAGFTKVSSRLSSSPPPLQLANVLLPSRRPPSKPSVASTSSTRTRTRPRSGRSPSASRWITSRSASGCVLEPPLSAA